MVNCAAKGASLPSSNYVNMLRPCSCDSVTSAANFLTPTQPCTCVKRFVNKAFPCAEFTRGDSEFDWVCGWCAVRFRAEERPVVCHPLPAHRHDWAGHRVLCHRRCVLGSLLLDSRSLLQQFAHLERCCGLMSHVEKITHAHPSDLRLILQARCTERISVTQALETSM